MQFKIISLCIPVFYIFSSIFTGILNFSNNFKSVETFKFLGQTQNFYHDILEQSVTDHVRAGLLEPIIGKDFYNYILVDGEKFFAILDKYGPEDQSISNDDFKSLKGYSFYAGKGKNYRKLMHLKIGKRLYEKKLKFKKISAKFSKISRIWEKGQGIICLQLFHETDHYMAHNREFALIKALGFNNLTNSINGTCYADMKYLWNNHEVTNFGNMLLYNAFQMCIIEPPSIIYKEDVVMNIRRCTPREKDQELAGILDYFIEM